MTYYDLLGMIKEGNQPQAIILYGKRRFVWTEDREYISEDGYQMRLNSYLATSLTDHGMMNCEVITLLEGENNG